MVLKTSDNKINSITETDLYKSLKQLQNDINTKTDSEWFYWISPRTNWDSDLYNFRSNRKLGINLKTKNYKYLKTETFCFYFLVNGIDSSVDLILRKNHCDFNYNLDSDHLILEPKYTMSLPFAENVFSRNMFLYKINNHRVSIEKNEDDDIVKFWVTIINDSGKERTFLLNKEKKSNRISKYIFTDDVFDELLLTVSSNFDINLKTKDVSDFLIENSFCRYKDITTLEKLILLKSYYTYNSKNAKNNEEKLTLFVSSAKKIFYENRGFELNPKENISNLFFWFVLENYCNISTNMFGFPKIKTPFFLNEIPSHISEYFLYKVNMKEDSQFYLSPSEQKQIIIEQLLFYKNEFSHILNNQHLKFLQTVIDIYQSGTIPSINQMILDKTKSIYEKETGLRFWISKFPKLSNLFIIKSSNLLIKTDDRSRKILISLVKS